MSAVAVNDPYTVRVKYTFDFEDGSTKSFEVDVDLKSATKPNIPASAPPWCNLDHHKCADCPLQSSESPICPAAHSIADIVEYFSNTASYSVCSCTVTLPEREIRVHGKAIQDALYPLIGLRLATSGCPGMKFFRPLARFHEPFATAYYTVFRATSNYLLQEFLRNHNRKVPKDFSELQKTYERANLINRQLMKRLEDANMLDASPNSIFVLSLFGISMTFLLDGYVEVLEELVADT